jgi:hypothetical protein
VLSLSADGKAEFKWRSHADDLPYETVGDQFATLGTITLKLDGEVVRVNDSYTVRASVKRFDDYYDFDMDWSRPVTSVLTWGAAKDHGSGNPYYIQIRGAINLEQKKD